MHKSLYIIIIFLHSSILTLGDTSLDAILQHLLQGVIVSADCCGVQHFYQVGHFALGQIVGDGVVPRVRHTFAVDTEHASGQSIQLAWAGLDVILCVVLRQTKYRRSGLYRTSHLTSSNGNLCGSN